MKYNRVMLGQGGRLADECKQQGYIGAEFIKGIDLSAKLPDDWRKFNQEFRPVFLTQNPGKTMVAAGLACGMLYTIAKGLEVGDIVLCPNGRGEYYVGKITGNYYFVADSELPHRRRVEWLDVIVKRESMSDQLKKSSGYIGTCSDITEYVDEIERLIHPVSQPQIVVQGTDEIEDPAAFALEKHLEDFLVRNWRQLEIGRKYDIYEEDGEQVGCQFPSDSGPIDILAISKDKKTLLVIELKRGKASDVVLGQVQRYMGYVKEELAEAHQTVKGCIIGLEADNRLKRALSVAQNIDFYRYVIDFKLRKGVL